MTSDHDVWLAGYRRGSEQVWCSNPECELHRDGMTVEYEVENGIGSRDVEECPVCGNHWLDLALEPDDSEEDE